MHTSDLDIQLAELIREWMVTHGCTLSTAESCTSGRIAATLTSVSGASDYFQGGIIVYQNALKSEYLGVMPSLIEQYDVVSEPVVSQMVRGCIERFQTDYAIASTGYTGDGSERVRKGTIWVACGNATEIRTLCLTEDQGREWNTANAAHAAISLLADMLKQK